MLIIKVMVCFLVIFRSEDYVGGLPTVQDSPDNGESDQSVGSASNQGLANEPTTIHSTEILDHAKYQKEKFQNYPAYGLEEFNVHGDEISMIKTKGKDSSTATESKPVANKFESTNDQAASSKLFHGSQDSTLSHETSQTQRFSSVYEKSELDEKVAKKKQEFKNDLSAYLTSVLDRVASGEVLTTPGTSGEEHEKSDIDASVVGTKNANNFGDKVKILKRDLKISEVEEEYLPVENKQRKSVVNTAHQQSTNMKPTRTRYSVQNKRSLKEERTFSRPSSHGLSRGSETVKNRRAIEQIRGSLNGRYFAPDAPSASQSINQPRFAVLNPIQLNAAMAYSNRPQLLQRPVQVDLSRALYQFGPAQLHALRGIFDKVPPATQNFKPISPEQVAYVPPKIIYDTKLLPTPFMSFGSEQKTVEALSALLGQSPSKQLEGFNLILNKDRPQEAQVNTPTPTPLTEVTPQNIHNAIALGQRFVTPIPSFDINSGLTDDSFGYSNDGVGLNEEISGGSHLAGNSFDQKPTKYPVPSPTPDQVLPNVEQREHNNFKTIPIVETPVESQTRDQPPFEKEQQHTIWQGSQQLPDTTREENESRYNHRQEEGSDHGESYAAKYRFGYHVKDYESDNDFGHEEARDGAITNGRYHVLLPDGRIQSVNYHVDEGGYHAKVSYKLNHAH